MGSTYPLRQRAAHSHTPVISLPLTPRSVHAYLTNSPLFAPSFCILIHSMLGVALGFECEAYLPVRRSSMHLSLLWRLPFSLANGGGFFFSLLWAHTHMLSFSLNPHGALYLTLEDGSLLFISHSQVMSFNCPTTWWLQASGCWCLVASATASSWSSCGSTQLSFCWPRPCFLTLPSH